MKMIIITLFALSSISAFAQKFNVIEKQRVLNVIQHEMNQFETPSSTRAALLSVKVKISSFKVPYTYKCSIANTAGNYVVENDKFVGYGFDLITAKSMLIEQCWTIFTGGSCPDEVKDSQCKKVK